MSASKYRCSFQLSLKNSARFVLMQNVLFSSNNNRRRWDVCVACRLARPALLLERNQLNKALNTKRKLTQSLYVFVVIFRRYRTVKGLVGGGKQEMMQDTPKKPPLTRSSRTLQNTRCKALSRSGLNSNQPQGRLFCSRPSSLITPSRGGGRREDYLKRINQLRKIIMSCSSCSLSLIIDNFASSHRFLLLNEEVYLEPPWSKRFPLTTRSH